MIDLNGIKVKNRIWLAAGAAGYGQGWPHERLLVKLGLVNFYAFGAVVTKTLTLEPRVGNYINPFEFEKRSLMSHFCHIFSSERKKVLRKVPGGWINNMGWWNVGIDHWVEKIYPKLRGLTIIPNIGGFVTDHYTELIHKLNPLGIAAIELNISCPNVENSLAQYPERLIWFFTSCRHASRHPLIVKLGIDCDYLRIARIAEYCGINAISAINSVPVLGGGYSGPAIKPIALKVVSDIKKATKLPVIGGGGITSWKDCQEFLAIVDAISLGSVGFNPLKPTWFAKKAG